MNDARKKGEDTLLLAPACGATVEAAARQCKLTERTISRRRCGGSHVLVIEDVVVETRDPGGRFLNDLPP